MFKISSGLYSTTAKYWEKSGNLSKPEQQHKSVCESSEIIVPVNCCTRLEVNGPKHLQRNATDNTCTRMYPAK